jgi:hypothetical protein
VNRRTFDLIIAVQIGLLAVVTGARVWARAVQVESRGPVLTKVGKVVQAVTG